MARIVSFVVLVAILLVIAGLFFRVMADFIVPVFLAVVLVIIFGPLHRWVVAKCRGHDRVAAGVSTMAILLIFLVPLLLIVLLATHDAVAVYRDLVAPGDSESAAESDSTKPARESKPGTAHSAAAGDRGVEVKPNEHQFFLRPLADAVVDAGKRIDLELSSDDVTRTITGTLRDWLAPVAIGTGQLLLRLLLGLLVMIFALYYFLADGPAMLTALMRISPLDDRYEEQLITQFDTVMRTMVVATLVSAFVQGLFAGIGFYFAGLGSVFLLMVISMLMAMVPFVGAASVWVPVCLYLYFVKGHPGAAIGLAIYGGIIVSTVDNIIKPMILHGGANLHPLLALLSVLGGLQALGPIGIFMGPMVVAFLQTLLNIFNLEVLSITESLRTPSPALATAGPSPPADPPGPKKKSP